MALVTLVSARFVDRSIRALALTSLGALWACPPSAPQSDAGTDAPSACPTPNGPGVDHAGTIAANETWAARDNPHRVPRELFIEGSVTMEPCVVVELAAGVRVKVEARAGSERAQWIARGEAARPVTVRRGSSARWSQINVTATGLLDFEHTIVEGGGGSGRDQAEGGMIYSLAGEQTAARSTPVLRLRSVRLRDSAGYGISLGGTAGFTDDSSDLNISGAGAAPMLSGRQDGRAPIYVQTPSVQTIPSGNYQGNARDEIDVESAQPVVEAEHFKNRGVPYRVLTNIVARPAEPAAMARITVDAGVTMRFRSTRNGARPGDLGLRVGAGGRTPAEPLRAILVANGTPEQPIRFESAEATPAPGDWAGIFHGPSTTGNVVRYVTVAHAGGESSTVGLGCGPSDNDGAYMIFGWVPTEAFIQQSVIRDSASSGIVLGFSTDASPPTMRETNQFINIANRCEIARWRDQSTNGCPTPTGTPSCI